MQINFTQVLQDSWNFFRNQQKIMLSLAAILFIIQIAGFAWDSASPASDGGMTQATLAESLSHIDAAGFIGALAVKQLLTSLVAAWGILTVHQISQQTYRTLGQSLMATLGRFAGVVVLDLLMVAPMLLGLAEAFAALLTKTSPSMMSLVAMIVGVWFFVRMNLTAVHYLSTQDSLGQTIKTVWLRGQTRKGALFIYALLVYFVIPMFIFQISGLSDNIAMAVIAGGIAALLNIFTLVVTYRFYSLFMKES